VKSHLPSLCIKAKSLNGYENVEFDKSWLTADERNIHICCKWDNQRLYEEAGNSPPIYTNWRVTEPTENKEISEAWLKKILDDQTHEALKPHMQMIISGVQQNDLLKVSTKISVWIILFDNCLHYHFFQFIVNLVLF